MKKWQKLFMVIVMIVMVCCMPAQAAAAASGDTVITLLHTNDLHGRVEAGAGNDENVIGLAELTAAVKVMRQKNAATLFVDAGDTIHGLPIINISKGMNMVSLLNKAGYDFMVPGNHDYNYGSTQLQAIVKQLNFPVLSANTINRHSKQLMFLPYRTLQLEGVKIAVLGLTTPETAYKTNPENIKDVEFLDPIQCAQAVVSKLRQDNDVVIAITHLGIDKSSIVTSSQLATMVKGIDVIIDGHSHTELPAGLAIGDTMVAQTGCHGHKLGCVQITIRDHRIIACQAKLYDKTAVQALASEPDEEVTGEIARIKRDNQQEFSQKVAYSDRTLSSSRQLVRSRESELGNLAADALRWKSQADVALLNGGSFRADLKKGTVTTGDILTIFPFSNTVIKVELSGRELKNVLEKSVGKYPELSGGFLQISGLSFSFDASKQAGCKVQDVYIAGQLICPDKLYAVAINDFLYNGGDGYDVFKNRGIIGEYGTCEDAFAEYLHTNGTQGCGLGRIRMANE